MASASSRRNASISARESPQKQAEQTVLPATCSHSVTKRLQQDLMTLMMKPVDSVSAFPAGDNLFLWHATIKGSDETPYEGLEYKLSLEFSAKYPLEAPVVKFITPCFHPNVDDKGNICLDILKEQWSALYDVKTVLISIQSLLGEPNNDSPLNSYAASLWENQAEYKAVLCKKYDKDTQQKLSK